MFAEVVIPDSCYAETKVVKVPNVNTHNVENGVLELWNETKKVASYAEHYWVSVELKEETENG